MIFNNETHLNKVETYARMIEVKFNENIVRNGELKCLKCSNLKL